MADYSREYLELLAEKYPNRAAACSEIVNLRAILSLPKGTEHFISDLHGEYGANDMCMGVPCIVGGSGLEKVVELPVTAAEKVVLDEKVASLNATYDSLGIRK